MDTLSCQQCVWGGAGEEDGEREGWRRRGGGVLLQLLGRGQAIYKLFLKQINLILV